LPANGELAGASAGGAGDSRSNFDASPSLVYLSLPVLLFLVLIVRPIIGVPVAVLVVIALLRVLRIPPMAPGVWAAAATGAVAVAAIAGFPFGPFPWDWFKHWALLNELAAHPTSLRVELAGSTLYLRFYLAAYLVPALAHHLVTALPLWLTTGAWFALGFGLVLQSATAFATGRSGAWWAVLLVLLLGGADFYAENLYRLLYQWPIQFTLGLHYAQWTHYFLAVPLEYSSFLTALAWVPHQSIATYLVAAMLAGTGDRRSTAGSLLGYGLLSLWSPYGMIGLSPLLAVVALQRRRDFSARDTWVAAGAGAGFAAIVISYLSTDLHSAAMCLECVPSRLRYYPQVVPFLALELAPFVLLLGKRLLDDPACQVCFITLLLIPLGLRHAGLDGPTVCTRPAQRAGTARGQFATAMEPGPGARAGALHPDGGQPDRVPAPGWTCPPGDRAEDGSAQRPLDEDLCRAHGLLDCRVPRHLRPR
jgi:hypothetical protein